MNPAMPLLYFVSLFLLLLPCRAMSGSVAGQSGGAVPIVQGCPHLLASVGSRPNGHIQSKFASRVLQTGGPIDQPRFFYRLAQTDLGPLNPKNVRVENRSPQEIPQAPAITIETLTEKILSGEFEDDLVFKPNVGMQGDRIFFLEQKGDQMRVSYAHKDGFNWMPLGALRKYYKIESYEENKDGNTVSFDFMKRELRKSSDAEGHRNILKDIWQASSLSMRLYDATYDSGIVEAMEKSLFKAKGLAYETRHHVIRGPNGDIRVVWNSSRNMEGLQSYARQGSSPLFSNVSGRGGRATVLTSFDGMFEPLFSHLGYPPEKRESFKVRLEELLTEQMRYMVTRYREAGLPPGERDLTDYEIDLLWELPKDENSFPRPILCESRYGYYTAKQLGAKFDAILQEFGLAPPTGAPR